MQRWSEIHATYVRASWPYRILLAVILGVCLGTAVAQAKMEGYARSELLAETDWLAQHFNDPDLRIVDLRSEAEDV